MDYSIQVIFAALRLTLVFLLLFGWLTPKFLKYAGQQNGIDRIVYSWVGLGGLLVISVFILVQLRLYDFISLIFVLFLLPVVYYLISEYAKKRNIRRVFLDAENNILYSQVRVLENFKTISLKAIKDRYYTKPEFKVFNKPYRLSAVIIAVFGALLRMVPAFKNASPFSRSWYFELDAIKNLSLQTYFGETAAPKGMHSIIHIFSTLTQVSPEMILHIMGSLTSFFLTVIIFWVITNITHKKYRIAALFGCGIYALFPVLFMPITFELQTTSSSLSLALCFAIPTVVFFLRLIREEDETPWLYLVMGIMATGLVDLFVFIMVLFPILVVSLVAIRIISRSRNFTKSALIVLVSCALTIMPYLLYVYSVDQDLFDFFKSQLFDSGVFSFYPDLILDIELLSILYMGLGLFLVTISMVKYFKMENPEIEEEFVFIILFCMVSFIYTPYFKYDYILIDPDQLNSFYSVLIAIFFGITFYSLIKLVEWLFKVSHKVMHYLSITTTVVLAVSVIILQGGIKTSRVLPQTLPNGFFNAYYKIISERVPYTYATVGPELDRILSKNRHFFMNYDFFLNNYGVIDSLYQQYLTVPDVQRENKDVPPASIFLFVEKPPYGTIQQGILYDSPDVMRDIEQWLNSFKLMENRVLKVYYEDENARIYEIVNRDGESDIQGILLNMYPDEEERASNIFE
ncbi:MAG: hypothetical protein FH748_01485 [Balneolaceae bacterium]|nr:hypothetical protein [Balneolaceae bacterium]